MSALQIIDHHDAVDIARCLKPSAPVTRFVLTGAITPEFQRAVDEDAPSSHLFDPLVEYVDERVSRGNVQPLSDWPS